MNGVSLNIGGEKIFLEENFSMDLNHTKLPFEDSPTRVGRGIICICTQGSADIEVDFVKHHMEKCVILSVFPMQIIETMYVSDDFSVMYFACSSAMMNSILFRFPPEFESFLKEIPTYKLADKFFEKDFGFFAALKSKFEDSDNICRSEIIINMIRNFYLEMYNKLQHKLMEDPVKHSRGTEIMKMFINLIMQYYNESRDVAFYANKLNISPKYLSMVTKEAKGQGAKELIDDFMVTEIKLQLKSTSKTIQEIAEELKFPNQSFLSKYFKKRTGSSPNVYRAMIK